MIIAVSGKIGSGKDTIGKIIQYLTLSDYSNTRTNQLIFNKCTIENLNESDWKIKKFADKLKDCVYLILGCTREQLEDIDFKNSNLPSEWDRYAKLVDHNCNDLNKQIVNHYTVREFLQRFGTEVGRSLHENTWVNATMIDYKLEGSCEGGERTASDGGYYSAPSHKGNYPNWIITDVRFPNEAQAIKDRDGIMIRVNRGNQFKEYAKEVNILSNGARYSKSQKVIGTTIITTKEHSSETALDDYQFDYVIDNFGTIEDLIEQVKQILIKEKII